MNTVVFTDPYMARRPTRAAAAERLTNCIRPEVKKHEKLMFITRVLLNQVKSKMSSYLGFDDAIFSFAHTVWN